MPKKRGLASSSLKMFRLSAPGDWQRLSGNWPTYGMMRGGVVYPLTTWARRTREKDGSYWPTPGAQDGKHRGTINTGLDRMKRGKQITLDQHVQLWPTLRASDSTHGGPNQRGSKGDLALPGAVRQWPTPTARDHKDGANVANVPPNGLLGRVVEPSPTRGSLTPEFCEWLMGFPKEWTVSAVWAMQLSHRKRVKPSKDLCGVTNDQTL